jgi:hypothetical protein
LNTQQLLELLKTWREFEGRLEWLEQYPPDTPIMDALRNAPHGGDNVGDQWLLHLRFWALQRSASLRQEFFREITAGAERIFVEAEAAHRQTLKVDLLLAWQQYELDSSEAGQKAHKQAVWRAYDKRYRADHDALVKFIEATDGLFEAVLEVLYNEHLEFQRALGDVCDDLVGRE